MTRTMRRTIAVLGVAGLGCILLLRLNPPEVRYPQPTSVSPKLSSALARLRARIGSAAPELTFRLIADDSVHRLSEFRGRPVLLTVWVTGCGPCWSELPALNALQDLHGQDRLAVITLTSSPADQVRRLAEKRALRLPPLASYSDRLSWVRETGGRPTKPLTVLIDGWIPNMAWPLTTVIDAEGKIREVTLGWRSEQQLQASVRGYV